jgi:hypothetical protein
LIPLKYGMIVVGRLRRPGWLVALLLLGLGWHISAAAFLNHTNSLLLGGTGTDNAKAVATGADGVVYLAGSFDQSIAVPGGGLTGVGTVDGFLLRVGPSGVIDWGLAVSSGSTDTDEVLALAVGGTNLYVGGYFQGTAAFPGTNLTAQAGSDAFIACFQTNGTCQWVRHIKGTGQEIVRAISVTPNGDIKVVGHQTSAATWDSTQLPASGAETMFILTVDKFGQLNGLQSAGSDNSIQPSNVMIGGDGTVLVSGRFAGTALGRTAAGSYDAFLAAFGSTGNYQWSFAGGGTGTGTDDGVGLGLASDGSVILGCLFGGTATFNGTPYTSTKGTWLGQFNTSGTVLSSKFIDGASVTALSTGSHGIVHVIGTYSATFTLDGNTLTASGASVMLASYLLAGWELQGVSTLTSSPSAFANKAAATADDGFVLAGFGQSSLVLDGATVASGGGSGLNAMMLRLTPPEYKLTVTTQSGSLLLKFPGFYYDATLQTNAAVTGTWGDFPASITKDSGLRSVVVPIDAQRNFYRLKR